MSVHRFWAMGCEVVVGGATDDERTSVERLFAALEQALSRFRPDWLERHGLDGRFVAESEVVVTRGWPAPSVAPRGVATCT